MHANRLILFAVLGALPASTVCAGELPPPLFEDVSAATGLKGIAGGRVSFACLDGDDHPDVIIGCTKIFLNQPQEEGPGRAFVRAAGDAVLNAEGVRRPVCVQVGDLNGDGVADLYLGRSTDLSNAKFTDDALRSEVWLGDGKGSYSRVAKSGVGTRAETTISATFVDYDRDGVLDLFCGNAYTAYGQSLEAFPDRLYRGLGDGRFEDVTKKAGLLGVAEPGGPDSRRPSYGVGHTDWNNDGLQDLLVMSYGRQWNRLWKNNGDGTFTDAAPATGFDGDGDRGGTYPLIKRKNGELRRREKEEPFRSNGNTFDAAVADFDGDGDMDVFLADITHWWGGSSSDRSALLLNEGPEAGFRFERGLFPIPRPHLTPRWNQGDLHAGWLDIDNDGRLDLLIASSDYPDFQTLRLYHQAEEGGFEDWTDRLGFRWLNATQISLADFDRDGATDILITTNNNRLTKEQRASRPLSVGLFRNLAAGHAKNGFFNLRLNGGEGANRDAVGARVSIWTGEARQTREVYGGLGHAAHRDDTDCRFGVGQAAKIDRIEVRWPDKKSTVQVFEDVAPNAFYRLKQGGELERIAPGQF